MTNQWQLTPNMVDAKIVLINNGTLGMVKQWQDKFFNQRFSHSVFNGQPDFMKMAEAYWHKGFLIDKPEQLEEQLDAAFAYQGPVLIEVRISPTEAVTPMVPSGKSNHENGGLIMTRILKLQVADQVSTLNEILQVLLFAYNIISIHYMLHILNNLGFLTWKFKSIFKMIHHFIY